MKSEKIKLLFFSLALPFLFLSCSKEDNQGDQSEIIFHVPVLKNDGKTETSEVIVYPNPFWNYINVHGDFIEGDSFEIQLSDENGNFSERATVTNGAYRFDTEHFPEGAYYIEIKKDGYVDRAKMLKLNWD